MADIVEIRSWELHICEDIHGEVKLGIVLFDGDDNSVGDIHWNLETAEREYSKLTEAIAELRKAMGLKEH